MAKSWGSSKYTFKRRIWMILKSPRIGFWRIAGKDKQNDYMLLAKDCDDFETLLGKIVSDYETAINNMPMGSKERRTKLMNLHRYAKGRY